MILVTGGAGFIGSALIWKLNEMGHKDIVVADRMGLDNKWKNLVKRQISYVVHKDNLFEWTDGIVVVHGWKAQKLSTLPFNISNAPPQMVQQQ